MWFGKYIEEPSFYKRLLGHPIIHSIKCLTIIRNRSEPSCLSVLPIDYLSKNKPREYHHRFKSTKSNVPYENSFKSALTTNSTTTTTLTRPKLRQTATSISTPSATATQTVFFTDTVTFSFLRTVLDMLSTIMEKRALLTMTVAFEDSDTIKHQATPNSLHPTYEAPQKSSTKKVATKTKNSGVPTNDPITTERVSNFNGATLTEDTEKESLEPKQDVPLLDEVCIVFRNRADN